MKTIRFIFTTMQTLDVETTKEKKRTRLSPVRSPSIERKGSLEDEVTTRVPSNKSVVRSDRNYTFNDATAIKKKRRRLLSSHIECMFYCHEYSRGTLIIERGKNISLRRN